MGSGKSASRKYEKGYNSTKYSFKFFVFPFHITLAKHLPIATNATKYLGLQLDSQLSWNRHVNYLLYKLSSFCYIMRLSHVLDIHTLRTIYFAHFHSLVNYEILFWGNTSSMCKIFLSKKKCCKLCRVLVQEVPEGNSFKNWRFYANEACMFIL